MRVAFIVFCLFFPETNARRPPRPADLDLGGVQAQLDALGLGVGEHLRQCPQTRTRAIGNRASTLGQEGAYLPDRAGDGGAVNPEQQPKDSVRQVVPKMNECRRHSVDEHQTMAGTGSRGTLPAPPRAA